MPCKYNWQRVEKAKLYGMNMNRMALCGLTTRIFLSIFGTLTISGQVGIDKIKERITRWQVQKQQSIRQRR